MSWPLAFSLAVSAARAHRDACRTISSSSCMASSKGPSAWLSAYSGRVRAAAAAPLKLLACENGGAETSLTQEGSLETIAPLHGKFRIKGLDVAIITILWDGNETGCRGKGTVLGGKGIQALTIATKIAAGAREWQRSRATPPFRVRGKSNEVIGDDAGILNLHIDPQGSRGTRPNPERNGGGVTQFPVAAIAPGGRGGCQDDSKIDRLSRGDGGGKINR